MLIKANILPEEELVLKNARIRFVVLDRSFSNNELSLLEKAGFQLYSDSFFYDLESQSVLFPVVGKKSPMPSLVREFKQFGFELKTQEIRFGELETIVLKVPKEKNPHLDSEILAKIQELFDVTPRLKEKKLLVELNSRDLALHFFL